MFAGKIHGQTSKKLLSYLAPIFCEGYRSLLRCLIIQNELQALIQLTAQNIQIVTFPESDKCEDDIELIIDVWDYKPLFKADATYIFQTYEELGSLLLENDDKLEESILRIWNRFMLQNIVICSPLVYSAENKNSKKVCRLHVNMVASMQFDSTRHLLYAAVHHYRCGTYRTTLRLIKDAKLKLQHPQLMYTWCLSVDKYRAAGGDYKTFDQMMTEVVACSVSLQHNISIPEIMPEHHSSAQIFLDNIVIPPLVLVHFLSFLCHHNRQKVQMASTALNDLCTLLHYDNGYHINQSELAISWQMLGICQEMSGDFQGSYQSYSKALQQHWCPIKLATIMRMQALGGKLNFGLPIFLYVLLSTITMVTTSVNVSSVYHDRS